MSGTQRKQRLNEIFYACFLALCKTNFPFLKETLRELLRFSVGSEVRCKTWIQFFAVLHNFGLAVLLSLAPFQITNGGYATPISDKKQGEGMHGSL